MSVYVNILRLSMLVAFVLHLDADNEDSMCESVIRVRRGTAYKAFEGELMKIFCPVRVCDGAVPKVTWFKRETREFISVNLSDRVSTEWKTSNETEGISALVFKTVLSSDSGQYQCRSGSVMGHVIQLSVVCKSEVKVHRDVMYNATAGYPLKISCRVKVCDNISVSWFKKETEGFMSLKISDRMTTKWIKTDEFEALYFLIFHKVLSSDSGQYQCQSSNSASHFIHVVVIDAPYNLNDWSSLFYLIGMIVFFIVIFSVYVILKKCKDAGKSRAVAKKCSSPNVLHTNQTVHINDNDL